MEVFPTAVQYRIIKTLGGMIGPSKEAEDMTAAENGAEYPSFFIIGIKNAPKDAADATASPTIDPISRDAPIVTIAIAPLNRPNHAFTNLISRSSNPPLSMSCPVNTKNGTAKNEKLFIPPYILIAIWIGSNPATIV